MISKKAMRVFLIHWNAAELAERRSRLAAAGFVTNGVSDGDSLSKLLDDPLPGVFIIDLERLPSHGREAAGYLQERKSTRQIPLVFAGGEEEKVKATKAKFPNAIYTKWDALPVVIREAAAAPRSEVINKKVKPPASGYSGTPLPQKLTIREGSKVVILNAPASFAGILKPLPENVSINNSIRADADVTIFFALNAAELKSKITALAKILASGASLWIAWPKKASGIATDLSEDAIRGVALPLGIVDTKVCAMDAVWSGLRFQRRKNT
ncbi:MAG: hypothetical protein ACKVS6_14155 [Planctomycetota bacterium]